MVSVFSKYEGIQSRGFPGLISASLKDDIVHLQATKQRTMLVLLSVQGSVQITIEAKVLSKYFSSQSHPNDLPITRICVFNKIQFWANIKGLFYKCIVKCDIPEWNNVHVMVKS